MSEGKSTTGPDGPCFMCEFVNSPEFDGECWMHIVKGESLHCEACKRAEDNG